MKTSMEQHKACVLCAIVLGLMAGCKSEQTARTVTINPPVIQPTPDVTPEPTPNRSESCALVTHVRKVVLSTLNLFVIGRILSKRNENLVGLGCEVWWAVDRILLQVKRYYNMITTNYVNHIVEIVL